MKNDKAEKHLNMVEGCKKKEGRIISIMQPHYLPYHGLYDLIDKCDYFVLYDDAQFERCSWQVRNRIRTDRGFLFLTVPVKEGRKKRAIKEVLIDYSQDWTRKHLKTIEQFYHKAPYYDEYINSLKLVYSLRSKNLAVLNRHLIELFASWLGITTAVGSSDNEDIHLDGLPRDEKLFEICRRYKADVYLSSEGGRFLYNKETFEKVGIDLKWHKYPIIKYPQCYNWFIPELSMLDLFMNCGPDSKKYMKGAVTKR